MVTLICAMAGMVHAANVEPASTTAINFDFQFVRAFKVISLGDFRPYDA
jgi:hypothetical protein